MKNFIIISSLLLLGVNGFGQEKAFTIYTYGGGPGNITPNTETIVGQKWNIEYIGTGNCIVSEELIDSLERNNKKTYKLLAKEYGTDWQERYNREFDSTSIKVRNIYHFLKQDKLIKSIKSPWTDFMFTSRIDNGNYLINVLGFGDWKGEEAIIKFYNLEVDFDKKKIDVLNDKIEFIQSR